MIDLSSLNKYRLSQNKINIPFIKVEVNKYGAINFLQVTLRSIDCTNTFSDGTRLCQTNGYNYMSNLSQCLYVIENYIDDNEKDIWYQTIIDRHNKNLEFEKENPAPTISSPVKKKQSNSKTRSKVSSESKEKKPTAAERKLAAKVSKLNALSVNLKIPK